MASRSIKKLWFLTVNLNMATVQTVKDAELQYHGVNIVILQLLERISQIGPAGTQI